MLMLRAGPFNPKRHVSIATSKQYRIGYDKDNWQWIIWSLNGAVVHYGDMQSMKETFETLRRRPRAMASVRL